MITCKIIEDLLPLYADEICSDDSRTIVEHHVAECNECREKLETMSIKLVGEIGEKYTVKNVSLRNQSAHWLGMTVLFSLHCILHHRML